MSVELLYTSAAKGLREGSRGFCTVLSTAGMPSNLATRLESLSGYKQLFATDSPQADSNPVAFSHVRFTLAGKPVSVISRVAAYGADYSGRTNKLAHHVVVDSQEAPDAGPAWLLQQPGIIRTEWDGNCSTPAVGPSIPQAGQNGGVCSLWQSITGDAGWGGVAAEALAKRSSKPTWIIYSLEQTAHLLPLLNEAIALLPSAQRWGATFSTYTAQLAPDVDCRVRCVVEGTDDARFAAARGRVVQLINTPTLTDASDLVQVARGKERPAANVTSIAAVGSIPRSTRRTRVDKRADDQPAPQESRLPEMPTASVADSPSIPDLPSDSRRTSWKSVAACCLVIGLIVGALAFPRFDRRSMAAKNPTRASAHNTDVAEVEVVKPNRSDESQTVEIDQAERSETQEQQTPVGIDSEKVASVPNAHEVARAELNATEDGNVDDSGTDNTRAGTEHPRAEYANTAYADRENPTAADHDTAEPENSDPPVTQTPDPVVALTDGVLTLDSMLDGNPSINFVIQDERFREMDLIAAKWSRTGDSSDMSRVSVEEKRVVRWRKDIDAGRIYEVDVRKTTTDQYTVFAAVVASSGTCYVQVNPKKTCRHRIAERTAELQAMCKDLTAKVRGANEIDTNVGQLSPIQWARRRTRPWGQLYLSYSMRLRNAAREIEIGMDGYAGKEPISQRILDLDQKLGQCYRHLEKNAQEARALPEDEQIAQIEILDSAIVLADHFAELKKQCDLTVRALKVEQTAKYDIDTERQLHILKDRDGPGRRDDDLVIIPIKFSVSVRSD